MNRNEYNQCVTNFAENMYRYALRMLKDTMRAEDIVQIVFEKLWLKREFVEFKTAKSYVMTAVYRTCIDHIRSDKASKRMVNVVKYHSDLTVEESQFETKQLIEKAFEALNKEQKSIILLRDYEGYSYKEIGNMMHLSDAQVKIKIFRTRKKLQSVIESIQKKTETSMIC